MGAERYAQGRIASLMMTFFRRFATSPVGLAVFAVILIAFVVTLYEGDSMFGGGVAKVKVLACGNALPSADFVPAGMVRV